MNKQQVLKILRIFQITALFVFFMEWLFLEPSVVSFFQNLIQNSYGWISYVIIWVIMFLQTTVLNIPAYVILSASVSIGIKTLSVSYFSIVLSAYMLGCMTAYWLGLKFGKKAVKWCAGSEEDYEKWSNVLNAKGKLWYFISVIFPLFPDDILCLVAGSVRLNFNYYFCANLIGRGVGLMTMLLTLNVVNISNIGFPVMLLVWFVVFVVLTVAHEILYYKKGKSNMNLLIIGNNVDSVALEIWKGNTNYTVLNNAYVWCDDFVKYAKKQKQLIVASTADQFKNRPINDVIEFLSKHNFIPVFVADNKKSFENTMYTALVDEIPDTILYTKNKMNKDYNEFINITKGYLLGKGLTENGNKTISTPRKRKRTTSKI